jgi:hypothetical protein
MIGIREVSKAAAAGGSVLGAEVGGYRLVRLLGAGPRASVFLGHADGHPPVAIKLFRAEVPPDSIEREASALLRAAGEHVVGLLDLAQDDRGAPAFVLERLPGRSVGSLLERRGRIRPGEAVTLLAPLAGTVARMHAAGVAHGGLDLGTVLFTEFGSPTLVGFGQATLFAPTATGSAAVAHSRALCGADLDALRRLTRAVLDGTDHVDPEVAAALAPPTASEGYADRLAADVFRLGTPEPIDVDAEAGWGDALPSRLESRPAGSADPPAGTVLLDALQLPEWMRPLAARINSLIGPRVGRVASGIRSVRRPFWIAGGAVAGTLAVALLLTPVGATSPAASPGATPTTQPGDPAAAGTPSGDPVGRDPGERAVLGDNPADAVIALLAARERCFRDLSVLCLDSVLQQESAAHRADTALLLAAQEGGELDPAILTAEEAKVVERLGDSALVQVVPTGADSEPAPVLLIRTEAGWRIRSFPSTARDAGEEPG